MDDNSVYKLKAIAKNRKFLSELKTEMDNYQFDMKKQIEFIEKYEQRLTDVKDSIKESDKNEAARLKNLIAEVKDLKRTVADQPKPEKYPKSIEVSNFPKQKEIKVEKTEVKFPDVQKVVDPDKFPDRVTVSRNSAGRITTARYQFGNRVLTQDVSRDSKGKISGYTITEG